jgi:hypothetical protein
MIENQILDLSSLREIKRSFSLLFIDDENEEKERSQLKAADASVCLSVPIMIRFD